MAAYPIHYACGHIRNHIFHKPENAAHHQGIVTRRSEHCPQCLFAQNRVQREKMAMDVDQMAAYAASAIAVLSKERNLDVPAMALGEAGIVTLTYPDGQVFEIRVTMLHGIDKESR
jgi:hypothetical protein